MHFQGCHVETAKRALTAQGQVSSEHTIFHTHKRHKYKTDVRKSRLFSG